jgi:REP element-mobilizing transposase RayT
MAGQPRRVAPTVMANLNFGFPVFGTVENGVMILNDCGKMVLQIWNDIPKYYENVNVDNFVVMPDHIHGIIKINAGATLRGCPVATNCTVSLPNLIYHFKTATTNKYIDGVKTCNWQAFNKKLWQRNYHEHIIRSEAEYARIAEYIRNNPISWGKNCSN